MRGDTTRSLWLCGTLAMTRTMHTLKQSNDQRPKQSCHFPRQPHAGTFPSKPEIFFKGLDSLAAPTGSRYRYQPSRLLTKWNATPLFSFAKRDNDEKDIQ